MGSDRRQFKHSEFGCFVMTITPEIAAEMLALQNNLRKPSALRAEKYAGMMRRGAWQGLNGETIKFDTDGCLIDGQHRLLACVMSKATLKSLVVVGVQPAPKVTSTIGIGDKRTVAETFDNAGHIKNAHCLAAAVRIAFQYDAEKADASFVRELYSFTPFEWLEFAVDRYPELSASVNRIVARMQGSILVPKSFLAWFHYECSNHCKQKADDYCFGVVRGEGLDAGHPALLVKNRLTEMALRRVVLKRPAMLEMLAQGWNAFAQGKRLKLVRYSHNAEPKPFAPPFGWRKPGEPWTGEVSE